MKNFVIIAFITLTIMSHFATAQTACATDSTPITGWFSPKDLYNESKVDERPLELSINLKSWKQVHEEPDRQKANSAATFSYEQNNFTGCVQARGQSRFNLFHSRAVEFNIGNKNYKVVNRLGGQKSDPKLLSSNDQNARVLVEYFIYKIYEMMNGDEAVKTRLAKLRFYEMGKLKDSGYGFFIESKGQVAKRFQKEQSNSWKFGVDSLAAIPGDLFRLFILDSNISNASNNFIYLSEVKDGTSDHRIAYDFDYTRIAPPFAISIADIPQQIATYRERLEKIYHLGTMQVEYPPLVKGSARQKEAILKTFRVAFLAECKKLVAARGQIFAQIPFNLLPNPYRSTMPGWLEAALKETQNFVESKPL